MMNKLLIIFLANLPSSAIAQISSPIIGSWSWEFSPHIGMTEGEEIIFNVYAEGAGLKGKSYSIKNGVQRELTHLEIKEVKFEGNEFTLILPRANHYYQGRISSDNQTLAGFLKHHAQKDDLKLNRVDFKIK